MDPATLIIIITAASGKQLTHTEEFRDVRICVKIAEQWRRMPHPKDVRIKASCKKWLKIAPAVGLG